VRTPDCLGYNEGNPLTQGRQGTRDHWRREKGRKVQGWIKTKSRVNGTEGLKRIKKEKGKSAGGGKGPAI